MASNFEVFLTEHQALTNLIDETLGRKRTASDELESDLSTQKKAKSNEEELTKAGGALAEAGSFPALLALSEEDQASKSAESDGGQGEPKTPPTPQTPEYMKDW